MVVCIDTNVVLGMFTAGHRCRPIFDAWFAGRFRWAVTTEILFEYEEIMQRQAGREKADTMMRVINLVDTIHGNLVTVAPAFRFRLIAADPDDDKFADCAITEGADWIITEDSHFNALVGSGYKSQPITSDEFIRRHLSG